MADRKKGGKKNKNEAVSEKLSKEDEAVAKFVRFNCPTKTTMFEGNEVHYFTASKAIDTLVESKKYGTNAKSPRFTKKEDALYFMEELLHRGYFFRAKKLVLKKKPLEDKKDDKKKDKEVKSDSKKASKKSKNEARDSETAGESAAEGNKKDQKDSEEDSKKKKKVKLIAHDSQVFIDSNDVYVWIFDPTPLYKKIIGLLMVLGTIAGCLFPLWPDWLRLGVYYVSVVGICLFGVLLGVALARTALFGIIWAATMGRHKLWLLPNLTEDCGFFESFKPWYTYEYCPGGKSKEDEKKSKKKDKNSDDEQEDKEVKSDPEKKTVQESQVEEKESDEPTKNSDEESENGSSNEISDEENSQEIDPEASETASDVSPKSERARKRRPRREDEGFVMVK